MATAQTFYQEIGTDVLPIELEKIGARVHCRTRQAPLRLLDPLGNVDPLAKAIGLDSCEILSQPTPRAYNTNYGQRRSQDILWKILATTPFQTNLAR